MEYGEDASESLSKLSCSFRSYFELFSELSEPGRKLIETDRSHGREDVPEGVLDGLDDRKKGVKGILQAREERIAPSKVLPALEHRVSSLSLLPNESIDDV